MASAYCRHHYMMFFAFISEWAIYFCFWRMKTWSQRYLKQSMRRYGGRKTLDEWGGGGGNMTSADEPFIKMKQSVQPILFPGSFSSLA